ncbi:MAG TPA: cholesterol catabolism transcriptional regulator KstR [Pseudonocardia sp.]|jgi:AcrR family transcriptional regulator
MTTGAGAGALGALPDEELGSAAQRERRKRILDATSALASRGGFEAVQMRAVAERADVALGTLYRYFPSKIHLLVSQLIREFDGEVRRLERSHVPGDTAATRVSYVLGRLTRSLQRNPMLAEAVTRAFMFADASVAAEVGEVGRLLDRMLATAIGDDPLSDEHGAITRVIADVWMANLIAWVSRRASAEEVTDRLNLAVRLLLGHT